MEKQNDKDLISKQLSARTKGLISETLTELSDQENAVEILIGQSDLGVSRNGGRRGARFGGQAILNILKKMNNPKKRKTGFKKFKLMQKEREDFTSSQTYYAQKLEKSLASKAEHLIHIGGGHDHIYPLLKAMESISEAPITVINIDAHCDTRQDSLPHSGTPFRQFSNETKVDFKIYQLGIHEFANNNKTTEDLKNGEMKVFGPKNLPKTTSELINYLNLHIELDPKARIVISLDCDAIDATIMEAVSAVNHHGLSLEQVKAIFYWARFQLEDKHQVYYGIYEYNPIYDNLSQKGARALASLIYETFY